MSGYYYLDITLKFQDEEKDDLVLTPAYFKGSIDHSLRSVFGEIGGLTEVDIFKFDSDSRRAIVRVPEDYYVKTRAAITLISKFQDIRCHFQVKKASPILLQLLSSNIEF
ncbi:ribonuclease P protein subunit p14-like [Episyrphus balteatus]|uniref:ribonuclease P protein subunit p14-like n=1 Tax=Episyrphus balteatus TaxID=286459 RepID=UPI0024869618|nr:ribonuclease P protein subunit p14-like [Episyrphus balteatus]